MDKQEEERKFEEDGSDSDPQGRKEITISTKQNKYLVTHSISFSSTNNPLFFSFTHTEGCGVSSGASQKIYINTMLNHMLHPFVEFGLLLEHGCEMTQNHFFKNELSKRGIEVSDFGWASIQKDGGIAKVFFHFFSFSSLFFQILSMFVFFSSLKKILS